MLGNPKDGSRNAFNVFFRRLGISYEGLLNNSSIDIYRDIRCGLAHAYLIEGRNAIIDIGYGPHGVDYYAETNKYTFYVSRYFEDFKNSVNAYINGLESGTEDLTKLEDALKDRPELI